MPASTIATDVRGALKTALAGCTALDNLEQLIISILGALNASKYELSIVERPSVTEVGTTTLLVSDIRLSVRYEQTA